MRHDAMQLVGNLHERLTFERSTLTAIAVFSLMAIFRALVGGALLTKPNSRQRILVGFSFNLTCTTNITNIPVMWSCLGRCSAHKPGSDYALISMSYDVEDDYRDRVELIRSNVGQYDLQFRSAKLTDAGTYYCQDRRGTGESANGVIIVIPGDTNDDRMTTRPYLRRTPPSGGFTATSSAEALQIQSQTNGSTNSVVVVVAVSVPICLLLVVLVVIIVVYCICKRENAAITVCGRRQGKKNGSEDEAKLGMMETTKPA